MKEHVCSHPILKLLSLALAFLAAASLSAQPATLVKDINQNPASHFESSDPQSLYPLGGKVFFAAGSPSYQDFWVTDGTRNGTEMLADPCPGFCQTEILPLGDASGLLFWLTTFDNHGSFQLWRSDGTAHGTFSLTSEGSGGDVEFQAYQTVAFTDRLLIFVGCTAETGCELWASNGNRAGTRLVKDLTPGPGDSALRLQAAGGKVFVTRLDPSSQSAQNTVWVTDGTAAGTVPIKNLGTGTLQQLTAAGSHLFFTFRNAAQGTEAWASDGTPAGTFRITNFSAPSPFPPSARGVLQASGRRVYFVADDSLHGFELWRSDGTPQGTERLTDFAADAPFDLSTSASFVEEAGNRAVFLAMEDGDTVPRLWSSRGSPATVRALPALPATPGSALKRAGDQIFFVAADGPHGKELWTTDGTAAGTRLLRDICPGPCDSELAEFLPLPEMLLFLATEPDEGIQLWKSDGTRAGTRRVTDFAFPEESVRLSLREGYAAVSNNRIFFPAGDARGEELWVSRNGRAPRLVADIAQQVASSAPQNLVSYQGRLALLATDNGFAHKIWLSDGASTVSLPDIPSPSPTSVLESLTAAGSSLFLLFEDFNLLNSQQLWRTDATGAASGPLVTDRFLDHLTPFAGSLYFVASDFSAPRTELWRSDGTPAGTGPVLPLPVGSSVAALETLAGRLYFSLNLPDQHSELWQSDGTAAGTVKLTEFPFDAWRELRLVRLGSRLYFLGFGSLWSTDGTPAGTRPVVSVQSIGFPRELAAFNGALYFFDQSTEGRELWRSDGSAAGTVRLATFPALTSEPVQLTAAAGRLFFVADDGAHGAELWTSDGTTAGTALVRDIFPGTGASHPHELTLAGGRLFFSAGDSAHGYELWQTDGTAAGTRMQDIAPGPFSSTPSQLTVAGGRLFFAADDGTTGQELWSLRP